MFTCQDVQEQEKEARKKFFDRHRQLKAGLDEQRQDEIRAEKVFRANAREQRAGYETPSDWTRARLDEIEAKKDRQGAYLRRL